MVSERKRFMRIQSIKAVGAKPISTRRGTFYKLGGGIFTQKQILSSRKRIGRLRVNYHPTS